MPVALASAVPVKTDHGATSPQPTTPALVVIFTMAPGIESSMSPTPCRRFILSGHLTTSTATPVIRNSLMTDLERPEPARSRRIARLYLVRHDPQNRRQSGRSGCSEHGVIGARMVGVRTASFLLRKATMS